MKNTLVILAIFFLGINQHITAQSEKMDEFTVEVKGLGCPFCAYGLEKKINELDQADQINIDIETGVMSFIYPSDQNLKIDQIEEKVKKAGYTTKNINVKRTNQNIETSSNHIAEKSEKIIRNIEFFVAGNCNMCKYRIEKTANQIKGVNNAQWNKESKQLSIQIEKNIAQLDIEKGIVKSGHDTKTIKSKKSDYKKLPECCKYHRI